jgi:hypothetical protein
MGAVLPEAANHPDPPDVVPQVGQAEVGQRVAATPVRQDAYDLLPLVTLERAFVENHLAQQGGVNDLVQRGRRKRRDDFDCPTTDGVPVRASGIGVQLIRQLVDLAEGHLPPHVSAICS